MHACVPTFYGIVMCIWWINTMGASPWRSYQEIKKKRGSSNLSPALMPLKESNAPSSSHAKEAENALPIPEPESSSLESSRRPLRISG
ncbi:hypothetical protein NL676_029885 [Syzygium grande]|nr:hypothetical protein NL676_029885 [Syzygium grande]